MKPLVNWLKVKRAAVCDITLIEKVQNKVNYRKDSLLAPVGMNFEDLKYLFSGL